MWAKCTCATYPDDDCKYHPYRGADYRQLIAQIAEKNAKIQSLRELLRKERETKIRRD